MKETSIVRLAKVRMSRENEEKRAAWQHLRHGICEMGREVDGYGLVVFKRMGPERVRTYARMYTRDPADMFVLPEMAHVELMRIKNESLK